MGKREKPNVACFEANLKRDGVVHHAVCNIIEPIFEKTFIDDSFANRRGKSTHRGIRRCRQYVRKHAFVLKSDIQKYFPRIPSAAGNVPRNSVPGVFSLNIPGTEFRGTFQTTPKGAWQLILSMQENILNKIYDFWKALLPVAGKFPKQVQVCARRARPEPRFRAHGTQRRGLFRARRRRGSQTVAPAESQPQS